MNLVDDVKRIALIGFPMAPLRVLPIFEALNEFATRHETPWEVVFSAEDTVEALHFLKELNCDGGLVRLTKPEMVEVAKTVRFPLVNFSSWLENPELPTVTFDEYQRGRLAAEHLLEKGFERFAILNIPGGWYMGQRQQGFVDAIEKQRGTHQSYLLESRTPDAAMFAGLVGWLRELKLPMGLFCVDDPAAAVLVRACKEVGMVVPRDLSIVTSSNRRDLCLQCSPTISSVFPDNTSIAPIAVDMLDRLMKGETLAQPMMRFMPEGVAERESSDTLAVDDAEVARALHFIRDNIAEQIDVSDVVRSLTISRITLERRFKKRFGIAPRQYIRNTKVTHAKKLLRNDPDLSLEEIAQLCGFPSRDRMRLVFLRSEEMSPREYRLAHVTKPAAQPGEPAP